MIVRGIWQPVYARLKERIGVWNTNYYSSGSSNHSPFDSFEFLNKCFCARMYIMRVCSVRILGNNIMWNPPKSFRSRKKEIIIFFVLYFYMFKRRVTIMWKRFLFSHLEILQESITNNRRESACSSFHFRHIILLHIIYRYYHIFVIVIILHHVVQL